MRDGEESEEGERFCLKIRSFPAPAGGTVSCCGVETVGSND